MSVRISLIIRDIPSVIPVIDNLIPRWTVSRSRWKSRREWFRRRRSFAQDIGSATGFCRHHDERPVAVMAATRSVGCEPSANGTSLADASISLATPTSSSGGCDRLVSHSTSTWGGRSDERIWIHLIVRPTSPSTCSSTAAESKGVGKLLSKPRVITQNNEKATVKQGTKIPIQTTINNTISVQYIDAVLKLEVTPQITAEGTVFMDVLVENTQIDNGIPRVQGIPALDTQVGGDQVLVADGGTVVIGGIIIPTRT